MFGLSYLELSLIVNMVAAFCFAIILLLINIPRTEYSKKLTHTRNMIALCFLATAWVFLFTLNHKDFIDFQFFSSMMVLVVTEISTASLSYALVSLLDEKAMNYEAFLLSAAVVAVLSIVLARSILNGHLVLTKILRIAFIAGMVVQCVIHTLIFTKVFRKSRAELALYYDEDEDHKLRWIRFCFAIMMLTEIFVVVYLLLPRGAMTIYVIWYFLFMLYFTGNYISFLGSHKLLLDAFAHKALSGPEIKLPKIQSRRKEEALSADGEQREKEFQHISKQLEKWVEEKKYREYDNSREEIAAQLKTTKELLQLYFSTVVGKDFRTWRTELRVEDAKALLLEDKKASTNLIGETTGFSDRSNFHRQFTKIVGCSPKEWRETDGHPEKSA